MIEVRWNNIFSQQQIFCSQESASKEEETITNIIFRIFFAQAQNKKENGNFLWKFVVPLQTHAGGQWLVSFCFAFFFAYFAYQLLTMHCCILHIDYWYHSRALVLMVVRLLEILFFAKNVRNLYQKHY